MQKACKEMYREIRNIAGGGLGFSVHHGMVWSEMKIVSYCTTELWLVVCWCLAICHIQSMTAVYNVAVKYDVIYCNFNVITTNTVITFPTSGNVLVLSVRTYNDLVLNKTGAIYGCNPCIC
jgi:hypothetical protein